MAFDLNYCAKGSKKTGDEFIEETERLAEISNRIEIDFNWPHDRNFEQEMDFLINLAKKKGTSYSVHAPFFDGGLNSFNDDLRKAAIEDVLYSIDMASRLGSKVVVLHPALEPYGLKIAEREKLEIDSYKNIALYARDKNIMIGLENEAQTNFWFPDRACKFEELERTILTVGLDNFGLALDIGHANVSGEDYVGAIEKFGKKLFHIHAHDNFGKTGKDGWLDLHLAPGDGEIKWDGVLDALEKNNYQGFFTIECGAENIIKGMNFLKN
ncbi:MAG: sugar phosphate isomerase/epimerase family protein [Candidatus Paceibacterota bacterium]|jgi:sugar phosphate isomerase/epimerase